MVPSLHDGWGIVVNEAVHGGRADIISDAAVVHILVEKSEVRAVLNLDLLVPTIADLTQALQLLEQWHKLALCLHGQLCAAVAADCLYVCQLLVSEAASVKPRDHCHV